MKLTSGIWFFGENIRLFAKNPGQDGDITKLFSKTETQKEKYEKFKGTTTASYKNLARNAQRNERNRNKGIHDQMLQQGGEMFIIGKNMDSACKNHPAAYLS